MRDPDVIPNLLPSPGTGCEDTLAKTPRLARDAAGTMTISIAYVDEQGRPEIRENDPPQRIVADARRFENAESHVAGKIGLGVAIDCPRGWGLEAIWAHVRDLARSLRSRLSELPGVTLHDLGQVQCGSVSCTAARQTASAVRDLLHARQVNVSVSRLTRCGWT